MADIDPIEAELRRGERLTMLEAAAALLLGIAIGVLLPVVFQ